MDTGLSGSMRLTLDLACVLGSRRKQKIICVSKFPNAVLQLVLHVIRIIGHTGNWEYVNKTQVDKCHGFLLQKAKF